MRSKPLILACAALALAILNGMSASAAEPLRHLDVKDDAREDWPVGRWTAVNRELFEEFERSLSTDARPARPSYLDQCEYQVRLVDDDMLEGEGTGVLRLLDKPRLVRLGSPSFAVSSLTVAGQPGLWGANDHGETFAFCPSDSAELRFQLTQRGRRQTQGVEFRLNWLTAASSRLAITVPASLRIDISGGVVVAEKPADSGWVTFVIEAGARTESILRLTRDLPVSTPAIDCDLTETIVATTTKATIQSDFGLQPQRTTPFTASISVPPDYVVLRVTMSTGERLPFERAIGGAGEVIVRLPELAAGQRTVFRLVAERSMTWNGPQTLPRIAPTNARLLHENWIVQFEKPLQLNAVEHPGFIQTGLSEDQARETWSFQGVSSRGTMTLSAGPPAPLRNAKVLSRLASETAGAQSITTVLLESQRGATFEWDFSIRKPWTIVSVESRNGTPVTWTQTAETDVSRTIRASMAESAKPGAPALLTITAAAPSGSRSIEETEAVVTPLIEGDVSRWAVAESANVPTSDKTPKNWIPIQVAELPADLTAGSDASRVTAAWSISTGMTSETSQTVPPGEGPATVEIIREKADEDGVDSQQIVTLIETRLSAQGGDEHLHLVTFTAAQPMPIGGWSVALAPEVIVVDVRGDGESVDFAAEGRGIVLARDVKPVRSVTIEYRTKASDNWLVTNDSIPLPHPPCEISHWLWRVQSPESRLLSARAASAIFATGLVSPSLPQRVMGPMGRIADELPFNPLSLADWRQVARPQERTDAETNTQVASFSGFEFPQQLSLRSWWSIRMQWLAWTAFAGALLAGVTVRRVVSAAYRTALLGIALAATVAWFAPSPWSLVAGAALFGGILAFLMPRVWIRKPAVTTSPATRRESSIGSSVAVTGAGVLLLLFLVGDRLVADELSDAPDVLNPQNVNGPTDVMYVSDTVYSAFSQWSAGFQTPRWLVRNADVKLAVTDSSIATVSLSYEILTFASGSDVAVTLPFEGVIFSSGQAATLNGVPVRLTPLADGRGIVVSIPSHPPQDAPGGAAVSTLVLNGELRAIARDRLTQIDLRLPYAGACQGTASFAKGVPAQLRTNAKGKFRTLPETADFEIGASGSLQIEWRRAVSDANQNGAGTPLSARAESFAVVDPGDRRFRTRLRIETPEIADPFSDPVLKLVLPGGATVRSVVGPTVRNWIVQTAPGSVQLTLDLDSPVVAHQTFDLDFTLPASGELNCVIPSLPLLEDGRLSGHQFAFSTGQAYELELLTKPDPGRGIWDVTASEAAFTLRRDLGLSTPMAALELESPGEVSIQLAQRRVLRVAEIEQTLTPTEQGVAWQGSLRIETSRRSALMHELILDPAITIEKASVMQNDVERLIRWIRKDDRLQLLLRDDRPGTHVVRLEGHWKIEPETWRAAPVMQVLDSGATRAEVVINSGAGSGGRLESRTEKALADDEIGENLRRYSTLSNTSIPEIRWLPPPAKIAAEQCVRLEESEGRIHATIRWKLFSETPQASRLLETELPASWKAASLSGPYAETGRSERSHDSVGLTLERTSPEGASWLSFAARNETGIRSSEDLPRLLNASIAPEARYIEISPEALNRITVSGDRLEEIPESLSESRADSEDAGPMVVFRNADWRILDQQSAGQESTGDLWSESTVVRTRSGIEGLTSILMIPTRLESMRLLLPDGCRLRGAWIDESPRRIAEDGRRLTEPVVLRSGKPSRVLVRWTQERDPSQSEWVIRTPSLDRFNVRQSNVIATTHDDGSRFFGGEPGGSIAAHRSEERRNRAILAIAEALPASASRPDWLVGELRQLAQSEPAHKTAAHESLKKQAQGRLRAWNINDFTESSHPRSAIDLPKLTDTMLEVAAADPGSRLMSSSNSQNGWLVSTTTSRRIAIAVWLVISVIVLRQALKLLTRWEVAERLAQNPTVSFAVIGLVWWLALGMSFAGFLLFALAAAGSLLRWRSLRAS